MGWLWILVTVIGVALLGAAMFSAWRANKHDTKAHIAQAERGAKTVRDDMVEDERRRGE
jgi:hypothetical protein